MVFSLSFVTSLVFLERGLLSLACVQGAACRAQRSVRSSWQRAREWPPRSLQNRPAPPKMTSRKILGKMRQKKVCYDDRRGFCCEAERAAVAATGMCSMWVGWGYGPGWGTRSVFTRSRPQKKRSAGAPTSGKETRPA